MPDDSRLRHAFLTGRPELVLAAAAGMPAVDLGDAVRIVALLAEKHDYRFSAAAARLAARLAAERRLTLEEQRQVLGLLEAMPIAPQAVALCLRQWC